MKSEICVERTALEGVAGVAGVGGVVAGVSVLALEIGGAPLGVFTTVGLGIFANVAKDEDIT